MTARITTIFESISFDNGFPQLCLTIEDESLGGDDMNSTSGGCCQHLSGALTSLLNALPNNKKGRASQEYQKKHERFDADFRAIENDRTDLLKLQDQGWKWNANARYWVSPNGIILKSHNKQGKYELHSWSIDLPLGKGRSSEIFGRTIRSAFMSLDSLIVATEDIKKARIPGTALSKQSRW